jgi:transcriptional regulator with XRE-family HTH domain
MASAPKRTPSAPQPGVHIRIVAQPPETVGARIARLRMAQGWTQEDLALEAGLNQATISWIEAGRGLRADTLHALSEALGVSMDDIWLGEDEDEDDEPAGPHAHCPAVLGCREGRILEGWVREYREAR